MCKQFCRWKFLMREALQHTFIIWKLETSQWRTCVVKHAKHHQLSQRSLWVACAQRCRIFQQAGRVGPLVRVYTYIYIYIYIYICLWTAQKTESNSSDQSDRSLRLCCYVGYYWALLDTDSDNFHLKHAVKLSLLHECFLYHMSWGVYLLSLIHTSRKNNYQSPQNNIRGRWRVWIIGATKLR